MVIKAKAKSSERILESEQRRIRASVVDGFSRIVWSKSGGWSGRRVADRRAREECPASGSLCLLRTFNEKKELDQTALERSHLKLTRRERPVGRSRRVSLTTLYLNGDQFKDAVWTVLFVFARSLPLFLQTMRSASVCETIVWDFQWFRQRL
ncbi:hypothetical protein L596_027423 [Steinernema carpocapsae]|uniref:Uncharacterized protein n=1 Tax=Steinernema carpocapsae TaxID=34508 RepID=A0A4U5M5M6_STECR|nr:hypothetical protein L596_027423 [Steinernema carpocapsae]